MREAAARALNEELNERNGSETLTICSQNIGEASANEGDLLDRYVRWVNEEAPRSRRHADPVGLAPSPSMKRRLRRQRHRRNS